MKSQVIDIDTMPAGREMDALMAEKVMGLGVENYRHPIAWKPGKAHSWAEEDVVVWRDMLILLNADGSRKLYDDGFHYDVPAYSTSIAAAMGGPVCEMERQGFWLKLTSPFFPGDDWRAGFTPHDTTGWNGRPDFSGKGKEGDGAEAICRATMRLAYNRKEGI